MGRLLSAAALGLVLGAAVSAFEPSLDRRALEEAISIGQSRVEPPRARFHLPYRITLGLAPVDFVEVITPFRRVVLAAEGSAKAGRPFGQREGQQVLASAPGELTLHVELTLHPHNTYISLPHYDVALREVGTTETVRPRILDRLSRFGPRTDGFLIPSPAQQSAGVLPGPGQPLTGGSLIATFAENTVDPAGVYDVVVMERNKTLAQGRVSLGRLR